MLKGFREQRAGLKVEVEQFGPHILPAQARFPKVWRVSRARETRTESVFTS
jgi:hypothetical protein